MLSMQGVDTDSTLARRLYTVPHTKMMIQNTILCAVAKLERRGARVKKTGRIF
jgi:hypothetical protein